MLTTAKIVATPGERMAFKVLFFKDGQVIAERPVVSLAGGQKLIETLLPLLQKHDGNEPDLTISE